MSPGFEMNIEELNKYSKDMVKLFVKECLWFYMPGNVHKILVHGAAIISGGILPIGQLSEEVQEPRNKVLRYCRIVQEQYICHQ
jgi:hypothetical protein